VRSEDVGADIESDDIGTLFGKADGGRSFPARCTRTSPTASCAGYKRNLSLYTLHDVLLVAHIGASGLP
jgi:hypothetical protein